MTERDCHPAWETLSPTGWIAGGSTDIDYTSRIDDKHEERAELFSGIPPNEFSCGYFVFVDSFSSHSRVEAKVHLLLAARKLRQRENWPKRLNGVLYIEDMIDLAMAECADPRISRIPRYWSCIADVPEKEWKRRYQPKYEAIYSLLQAWAWSADSRVWSNAKKVVKSS